MEKTLLVENYSGKINGMQTSAAILIVMIILLLLALLVCVLLTSKYKLYGSNHRKNKNSMAEENKKPVHVQAEFQ